MGLWIWEWGAWVWEAWGGAGDIFGGGGGLLVGSLSIELREWTHPRARQHHASMKS